MVMENNEIDPILVIDQQNIFGEEYKDFYQEFSNQIQEYKKEYVDKK